jgi:hypothetical protein
MLYDLCFNRVVKLLGLVTFLQKNRAAWSLLKSVEGVLGTDTRADKKRGRWRIGNIPWGLYRRAPRPQALPVLDPEGL